MDGHSVIAQREAFELLMGKVIVSNPVGSSRNFSQKWHLHRHLGGAGCCSRELVIHILTTKNDRIVQKTAFLMSLRF